MRRDGLLKVGESGSWYELLSVLYEVWFCFCEFCSSLWSLLVLVYCLIIVAIYW